MTTRDVTSASRNLLIIYWVVSAFCSYQLGMALRVTTKLVGFATFYLGFMSLVHVPILMAASLGLCIFPKHTPHIWRKIRIPTILIWIIEVSLVFWTGVFLSPGRRICVIGKETGPGPGGYG